ncbi:nucleotidyltransferase family protein [Halothermothrix orenii]|uniref:MobA-like NTP transferase domain-containing protein n=1 Tax=Halothermothrix orenii (strain H 168 / OCM 544 / DSM 9562) TaxID=373903 RepID=B8D0E4_HALOH|nr:nucleotidyltransferase family protein [Halothermothrix orenii]ACL70880.1 hypothetical protein Hore_21350 [Halothermothrix orenii H 168]
MTVDVLILAGAPNKGALKKITPEEHEALIKIKDMPMVEYVIKAVNRATHTGKVVVVGPREQLEEYVNEKIDLIVDSGDSLVENIQKGFEVLDTSNLVLLMTSDIPLITEDVIDEFILSCNNEEADIYYPIIPKEKNKAKYPNVKRTYVHLVEGTFTGGNMVLIKPTVLQNSIDLLRKAVLWRKKPWKLSQILGMKFIFKFLMGNLSIEEIQERVKEITGYKGVGMITEHPEIGFDVDKPSDLKLMRDKYIL